jgi:hypothetical protein
MLVSNWNTHGNLNHSFRRSAEGHDTPYFCWEALSPQIGTGSMIGKSDLNMESHPEGSGHRTPCATAQPFQFRIYLPHVSVCQSTGQKDLKLLFRHLPAPTALPVRPVVPS